MPYDRVMHFPNPTFSRPSLTCSPVPCAAILVTALLGTATVFVCFTLAALLAKRREYLYLGGLLGSAIFWMMILSLLNAFVFKSPLAFTAELVRHIQAIFLSAMQSMPML